MPRTMAIALAALLLTLVVACGNENSSAIPIPTNPVLSVTINEPTTVEATITEKQGGSVTFDGTVSIDKLGDRVVVNLNATLDTGWACSISPSTIILTDTAQHQFSVSVIVPEATHADVVGLVKVIASASGTGYPVTGGEARANVTVAPYYMVMLNSSAPYEEVLPGQAASFTVVVKNPGNAVDSYVLEIENVKQLKELGWSVELDKTSISNLGANGEAELIITAKPSQDWNWELYKSEATVIVLKATSLGAQANSTLITQIFPVRAYQKGFNTPLVNLISGITVALVVLLIVGLIIRRQRRAKRRKARESGEPENK